MDIKDKLSVEHKAVLKNLAIEVNVLQKLMTEHRAVLEQVGKEILTDIGLSTAIYNLAFNPGKDLWEANLKEDALVVPNPPLRKAMKGRNN